MSKQLLFSVVLATGIVASEIWVADQSMKSKSAANDFCNALAAFLVYLFIVALIKCEAKRGNRADAAPLGSPESNHRGDGLFKV